MEFGLDKCAKASFKRGKKVSAEGIPLNDNQVIQDLDQAKTYKYLGMEEGEGVQHHKMKVNIRKEYNRRIKLVLKSELNARNKIAAINTIAVPVILYSYGVTDWKLDEIQDLNRMTREATVYEPDASQEGRCREDIPPMPRRWKITHES